jgi:hypothetical protein
MWILLRIVAGLLGALYRYFASTRQDLATRRAAGVDYAEAQTKSKSGNTTSHRIGVPLAGNICFAMTRESGADRLFKFLGFSRELQTGDADFDERIYIASDHLEFGDALRDDAGLRERVAGMLAGGFDRIWSNGHMLYAVAKKEIDAEVWVPRLDLVRRDLAGAAEKTPSRFGDPFVWRALVVECIVWSMAGYAAVAAFDFWLHRDDHYLDRWSLLAYGAVCAGAVALGLLVAIVLFLKRSSRSHRILVESALILSLSTPVVGVQMVADLNHIGAASAPMVVRVMVTRHWTEEHRGKRGRRWYTYHMNVSPIAGAVPISGEIDVSPEVYQMLRDGTVIPIEIGEGLLGLRWYKSINGVTVKP